VGALPPDGSLQRRTMFELLGVTPQALFGQLLLGLINGAFYAMLSLGLAVIFGMLNVVNFAHGALYMTGAFVAWLLLDKLGVAGKSVLVVTASAQPQLERSVANLPGVDVIRAEGVNVYDVLRHERLVIAKDAVTALAQRLGAHAGDEA